jgi:choline dehydrogenase
VQSTEDIDAWVRQFVGTAMHPVGTCAMGTGPEAVCDAQLKLRGIDGLRIADASVMPRIVGGNTNAATIMIGEKAADLIRQSHAESPSAQKAILTD